MLFRESMFQLHRSVAIAMAVVGLLLSSCSERPRGGPRMQAIPVHGELFVNGEPAKDAYVWLHPVTPHDNPDPEQAIVSKGRVDEQGKFQVGTYEAADGTPIGEYKISITWNYASGMTMTSFNGPDRLDGAYADPEKTGLTVSVKEQSDPVIIPKIELEAEIKKQERPKMKAGGEPERRGIGGGLKIRVPQKK